MSQVIGNTIRSDGGSSGLVTAAPLVGRLLIGMIFLVSGFGKIAAPAATVGYIGSAGLPLPQVALALAIIVELAGSLALFAGFHTRTAATVLAVFTFMTAVIFHTNFADQNQFINFMKNISIVGGLLQVIAFGGGRFSLDYRSGSASA